MITSFPVAFTLSDPPARTSWRTLSPTEVRTPGSWRYENRARRRSLVVIAALLSATVHAALIFGVQPEKKKPVATKPQNTIAITLAMPKLEELEEPEVISDETREMTDHATLVPMQADLPQVSRPNEFVQQINFTSLLEKPDLSNLNINVIPDTFRGGRKLAESIGQVFNLSDLDRTPEPVLQQAPFYPMALKREGLSGSVKVQFVVDRDGRVLDAHAVEASHEGFIEAAVIAVTKWKFRPGVKAGRKVNTRMAVPIVFRVEDIIN